MKAISNAPVEGPECGKISAGKATEMEVRCLG